MSNLGDAWNNGDLLLAALNVAPVVIVALVMVAVAHVIDWLGWGPK
jgi:hypothetical protein